MLVAKKSRGILKYTVVTRLIEILTHEVFVRETILSRVFFAYTNVKLFVRDLNIVIYINAIVILTSDLDDLTKSLAGTIFSGLRGRVVGWGTQRSKADALYQTGIVNYS